MKRIIFASAVIATLVAGTATAANTVICAAPTSAGAGTNVTASSTTFIKQDLVLNKCSANVHLVANDGGSFFGVGAVSSKGKSIFQGSSAGGAVKSTGLCATAGKCLDSEAATSATNAPQT